MKAAKKKLMTENQFIRKYYQEGYGLYEIKSVTKKYNLLYNIQKILNDTLGVSKPTKKRK